MRRGFLIAITALALAGSAQAGGPSMTIGAAEDIVKQPDLVKAKAELDLARLAGLDSIRITQIWTPGETGPSAGDAQQVRTTVSAASLAGVKIIATVMPFGSKTTPLTDADQAQFAQYTAAFAKAFPEIGDVIVGNEPNLNRFWLPQFGPAGEDVAAPAYVSLLARTYDALKAVRPTVRVLGGAVSPRGGDKPSTGRDTHSPTAYIADMGAAYRASGRTAPLMDVFAFHPYEENSSTPPTTTHTATTTIALADYDKLVAALGSAFDGTAQAGSTLPIVYDEFGVEALIPATKAGLYTGAEPATVKAVDEATQAAFYRQALQLAYCQPNVVGLYLFHVVDEPGLPQWQSGVYYVDGTPKSSLATVSGAAQEARRGVLAHCAGLQLAVKVRVAAAAVTCDLDCSYTARLQRMPKLGTTRVLHGDARGGKLTRLVFGRVAAGRYRVSVVARARVNPGPAAIGLSPTFRR